MKQAAAWHRDALAGGGVGAGTGSALFRESPPSRAPPSVTGKTVFLKTADVRWPIRDGGVARRRGEASGSVPQRGTRWGRGRRRPYVGPEPPPSWEGAGTRTATRTGRPASSSSSRGGRVPPCAEAHARPSSNRMVGGGRRAASSNRRPPFAGGRWSSDIRGCRALGAWRLCGSASLKQEADAHVEVRV